MKNKIYLIVCETYYEGYEVNFLTLDRALAIEHYRLNFNKYYYDEYMLIEVPLNKKLLSVVPYSYYRNTNLIGDILLDSLSDYYRRRKELTHKQLRAQ